MRNPLVTVEREGKVIGRYRPQQLASLCDTGHFRESDLCSSEERPEKITVRRFLRNPGAEASFRSPPRNERYGSDLRQKRRADKLMGPLLAGWILFFIAVALLLSAGFWVNSLYDQLAASAAQVGELGKKLEAKEKDYQHQLFAAREIAGPGLVRGSLILRNESGKRIAMPGIRIFLFPRAAIESHLAARAGLAEKNPAADAAGKADFFTAGMPNPIASTTTDASGRFEFRVPEEGEYVLHARLNASSSREPMPRLWFVSFNSRDTINSAVDLGENNFVRQFLPSLMIANGR